MPQNSTIEKPKYTQYMLQPRLQTIVCFAGAPCHSPTLSQSFFCRCSVPPAPTCHTDPGWRLFLLVVTTQMPVPPGAGHSVLQRQPRSVVTVVTCILYT